MYQHHLRHQSRDLSLFYTLSLSTHHIPSAYPSQTLLASSYFLSFTVFSYRTPRRASAALYRARSLYHTILIYGAMERAHAV